MNRALMLMGCAAVALLAAGCSSYNRHWKQALAQPVPPGSVTGPWEGGWSSETTGHKGRLRCILTETAPNEYSAHFHATWKKVLHGQYKVALRGQREESNVHFTGEHDLGRLFGGVFHYRGVVTPTNFFSTYRSSKDHGRFEMTRPAAR